MKPKPAADPDRPQSRKRGAPACYAPCPHCRCMVLTGETSTGHVLAVEPGTKVYAVSWPTGAARPMLHESRGYPVHRCAGGRV